MSKILITVFALIPSLAFRAAAQQAGPTPDQLNSVDALFAAELARQNYAGVSAGIVYGNQLIWTKGYGLADVENNVPATADTVYNMGSIGKQFTALMLLQLVDRGVVHLADPVERYVPEVARIPNRFPGAAPMTLIQLATHTSGVVGEQDEPPGPPGPRSQWEQLLISVFPQIQFDFEPGTRYQYSNMGYAILGLALERAAGQPYLDYLPGQIFGPLGMTHTAFDLTPDMAAHVAKGYSLQNGVPTLTADPAKTQLGRAYLTPAGGLFTTVGDMAKFVALELVQGPDAVLSRSTVAQNFSHVSSAMGNLTFGYGIGFGTSRRGTSVIAGHNGAVTSGYYAAAYIAPPVGMIFLRNAAPATTAGEPFGTDFYFTVLNAATPACPAPTIAAVTNASNGPAIHQKDTMIVWGNGFTSYGGNLLTLSNMQGGIVNLGEQDGSYYWDFSSDQVNAALTAQVQPGPWQAAVTNACGSRSAPFAVTVN
jgi:CubicO group peptidase (beta-lactamase class C family)